MSIECMRDFPASGIGSSFYTGAGENRVFFNAYSFSKSGKAYPASLEVGTFQLRARWGGEYTIHNVNYLVGTPGGMDRYECASGDLVVTVSGATVTERFTDVPADAWFVDAVDFTVKKGLFQGVSETEFAPGLINGMGDGTLAPQETSTRALVAQLIMNFHKFIG